MKKLYFNLFSSFALILAILFVCLFLSNRAKRQINEISRLLLETPDVSSFSSLSENIEESEALKDRIYILVEKTKKAEASLAFFVQHGLLDKAVGAASALASSAESGNVGEYAVSRAAFLDALENILRVETPSLELFL